MEADILVKLALQKTGYTQKELAVTLGVSPTQITKWKSGEHISPEMEEKFKKLLGIGKRSPDVVLWTGGIEQADKWTRLIQYLGNKAQENSETFYDSDTMNQEDAEYLSSIVLGTLIEAGMEIPLEFPNALIYEDESLQLEGTYLDKYEDLIDYLSENEYTSLIWDSMDTFFSLEDFVTAFIHPIIYDERFDYMDTSAVNIEPCLFSLALAKTGEKSEMLKNFKSFKIQVLRDYGKWLYELKCSAIKHGFPLTTELMDMLLLDPADLFYSVEAEVYGFNQRRRHPDIYTNELLESVELIHKILPAIVKKLGISQEELGLDE